MQGPEVSKYDCVRAPSQGVLNKVYMGGLCWQFRPLPFNILIFFQNGLLFIYLEKNCTPFLYLKSNPKQQHFI